MERDFDSHMRAIVPWGYTCSFTVTVTFPPFTIELVSPYGFWRASSNDTRARVCGQRHSDLARMPHVKCLLAQHTIQGYGWSSTAPSHRQGASLGIANIEIAHLHHLENMISKNRACNNSLAPSSYPRRCLASQADEHLSLSLTQ